MTGNENFDAGAGAPQHTPSPNDLDQGAPVPQTTPPHADTDLPWATRPSGEVADAGIYGGPSDRPPYVRQRAPRKTVEAIDDLANEAGAGGRYAHDSNVAVSGGAFSGGRAYRKARSNKSTMQGGQYGQYLEVPKGRRSLFESRERARRRKSILALGAIVLDAPAVTSLFSYAIGASRPRPL